MAIPLPADPSELATPFERPADARALFVGPPAAVSDSYLGGRAAGFRLVYSDAMQFVWWSPDTLPESGS